MTGLLHSRGAPLRHSGSTRGPHSTARRHYGQTVGDFTYRRIVSLAKGAMTGLGLKLDVVGEQNIPAVGGAILAINHIGYPDFIFAGIPADRRGRRLVRFMAKHDAFTHPVSGPLMRSMSHIPVDRDAGTAAFRAGVDAAKAGELVGVFPEATMSRAIDVKDIKSGAVRMARAAKVPLIPMAVFGTHRLATYNRRDLSRGTPIAITVGEAIPTAGDPEEVTLVLRERMQQLLDETIQRYPERPATPEEGWWIQPRYGGSAPSLEEAAVLTAQMVADRAARKAEKQAKEAAKAAKKSGTR